MGPHQLTLNGLHSVITHTIELFLIVFLLPRLDIFLSTAFGKLLGLCSSVGIRGQVLNPNRKSGNAIILYVLILKFRNSRQKEKGFRIGRYKTFVLLNPWQIHTWISCVVVKLCCRYNLPICVKVLQWLIFWALHILQIYCETTFWRLGSPFPGKEPFWFGPVDRASPYLRTNAVLIIHLDDG